MNCDNCVIECDYEVILTYVHTEGIEEFICSQCMEE